MRAEVPFTFSLFHHCRLYNSHESLQTLVTKLTVCFPVCTNRVSFQPTSQLYEIFPRAAFDFKLPFFCISNKTHYENMQPFVPY